MTTTNDTTIAFIGLGAMGSRMARNLVAADFDLRVFSRSGRGVDGLDAYVASSPADAARGAAIIMSMVRDDDASRAVWLGENGALVGASSGSVAVEMSTLTAGWVSELSEASGRQDVVLVDAPVAGTLPQAEGRQLVVMAGGPSAALDRVRPALAALSSAIHHVGETSGDGATLKLAVNALFGIQVAAMAELLELLRTGGLDPAASLEILGQMPVMSPAARGVAGLMLAERFAPLFPIDLVAKDFGYAAKAAEKTPITEAALAVYLEAIEAGYGAENITAVARLYA